MRAPEVIVCAGGGGVGKTTTSSALALSLARSGRRALIVSIDPARRLADALGVAVDGDARALDLDAGDGALFGLMPDPRYAMRAFMELLFENEPEALARLLDNRLYQVLEDAVPGIHELVAMALTGKAIREHKIDVVVIDTAPSRYAVDFVRYPARLAKLLGGKAVGWLARLAKRGQSAKRGVADNPNRAERLLARVMGAVVYDVAGFFAELAMVRKRFVLLTRRTSDLLLGPRTRYVIVAAPTASAHADSEYLIEQLTALELPPVALILNCALSPTHDFRAVLSRAPETTPAMHQLLQALNTEDESREQAVKTVVKGFKRNHRGLPQLLLPFVEAHEPRQIVETLTLVLDSELSRFVD